LGYLDDLIIIPLGILAVVQHPAGDHGRTSGYCCDSFGKAVSRTGAVVIVLIWIASIAIIAWLGYRFVGRWKW
jgi:hypothetical protein